MSWTQERNASIRNIKSVSRITKLGTSSLPLKSLHKVTLFYGRRCSFLRQPGGECRIVLNNSYIRATRYGSGATTKNQIISTVSTGLQYGYIHPISNPPIKKLAQLLDAVKDRCCKGGDRKCMLDQIGGFGGL
jgi:hypothetical protein